MLERIFAFVDAIGADTGDTDTLRLQKRLMVRASCVFSVVGMLWGVMYFGLGEIGAGSIPFGYGIFVVLSIVFFGLTRQWKFFRFSLLLLMLLLPFCLSLALGGIVSSSAAIVWSFVSPMGALLITEPRQTKGWLVAFVALTALAGILEPFIARSNQIPPALVILFFVMNISAIASIVFVMLYYFVAQKDLFMALLHAEQEKSEGLLLNVLPKEIAAVLKNGAGTIADSFETASVLFADIVNFTPLSVELSPTEMVEVLNEIFSHFDALAEKYGVEKIRTIGDNYMAASGVPVPRPDHAQALARMALDMCQYIRSRPPRFGKQLDFRMGINSGPVVAGVIGRKKFHYDLWGDPVNTASRMESHGVPGRIQITPETYELIKGEFECEARGKVAVKGKGEMETWYLVGLRSGT